MVHVQVLKCQKRPTYMKRDLHISSKRDLQKTLELLRALRRTNVGRDQKNTSKETRKHQKRPTKETHERGADVRAAVHKCRKRPT